MLTYLIIRNFAIIDSLELEFSGGFTVITGETGAGKSIIVDALNLVLGGRASVDVVRADAERAVVEATFALDDERRAAINAVLEAQGIEARDELLIRRVVQRQGRSRAFINGSVVGLSTLKDVTEGLVDISGQHEHYSLMMPENHIDILDRFGEARRLSERVASMIARFHELKREAKALRRSERERLSRVDFLRFQLAEIDRALIDPESREEMEREQGLLRHAGQLREEAVQLSYALYEGDQSAKDVVSDACRTLGRIAGIDPRLEDLSSMLEQAQILLSEVGVSLRRYARDVEVNPRRLEQIEELLHDYKQLERKYGDDFGAIIEQQSAMRAELKTLDGASSRIKEAEAERDMLQREVMAQARELSARRKEAAGVLKAMIEAELTHLGMERCRFDTTFTHSDGAGGELADIDMAGPASLNDKGLDQLEFLICPNPGEGFKPLARIASGGELSRIMLAIKNALMATDPVPTYVFDEVDSGIGGAVADAVGEKIKKVAQEKQVISITHLPQIAAYGDSHLKVTKVQGVERTTSSLDFLDEDARIMEVARMLGGRECTPTTVAHARELIRARV